MLKKLEEFKESSKVKMEALEEEIKEKLKKDACECDDCNCDTVEECEENCGCDCHEKNVNTVIRNIGNTTKESVRKISANAQSKFSQIKEDVKSGKLKDDLKDGTEKLKKKVLGEDGKLDKSDLSRVKDGLLEVSAGLLGAAEHGFSWAKKKLENLKSDKGEK